VLCFVPRFWADYVTPWRSGYIVDDEESAGGLPPGALFVIAATKTPTRSTATAIPGRPNCSWITHR
jgi:hypothetical protein